MATAYSSLALLAATLAIGPYNLIRGRPNPVSTYLRRDLGIWTALLALAHVVVGLQVHLAGRLWLYFVPPVEERKWLPVRFDSFGLANYTGLASMLILLLLLAISNDRSLRTLGAKRWKRIQRWAYAATLLMAAHGGLYQVIEKRTALWILFFVTLMLATGALQLYALRKLRR